MIERPRWDGHTVVCIASGPSLTEEDCALVRLSEHPTVVTNTTFRLCPWADALYGFDARWWRRYHEEVRRVFFGKRYGSSMLCENFGANATMGLPWFRQFKNSGVCAISLALSGGAAKVALLGYDCGTGPNGETHHHGAHPEGWGDADSMANWPQQFAIVARDAKKLGVPIVNASRRTALNCFPQVTLEDALTEDVHGNGKAGGVIRGGKGAAAAPDRLHCVPR